MIHSLLSKSLAAGWLLLGAAAPPAFAQGSGGTVGAKEVASVLRSRGEHDERTKEDIVSALGGLGEDAAPALVAFLDGSGTEAVFGTEEAEPGAAHPWWGRPDEYPELVRLALHRMPTGAVLGAIEKRAEEELEQSQRRILLELTGDLGDARGVVAWGKLSRGDAPATLVSHRTRRALVEALREMAQSDGRTLEMLEPALDAGDDLLFEVVVRAVGRIDRPEAMQLLMKWLDERSAHEVELIDAIATLCEQSPWVPRIDPRPSLRARLLSQDPDVRRAAVVALGRVTDVDGFELVVQRLADADRGTQRSAHWALRTMTGSDLGREAEPWLRHLSDCRALLEQEDDFLTRLGSDDPSVAVAAVGELARWPLLRHEAGELLETALRSPSREVASATCTALLHLGARGSVPALVELLTSQDDELREEAWETLQGLTGARLPLAHDEWNAYVHLGVRR